jgi:hypothetical protein
VALGETLGLADGEAEGDCDGVIEAVTVPEGEDVEDTVLVGVEDWERVGVTLRVAVRVAETVLEAVAEAVTELVGDCDGDTVALADRDAVMDAEAVLVAVALADGLEDGVGHMFRACVTSTCAAGSGRRAADRKDPPAGCEFLPGMEAAKTRRMYAPVTAS